MTVHAERIATAFERAPLLVDRLVASGPYGTVDEVMRRAGELIAEMTEGQKVAVLDRHPRIGADPATLSASSRREQGDGEDRAVIDELARLNDEYERRFGFRFVVFVNGRPRSAIVPVLRARLAADRADELARGMDEYLAISRSRLERA